MQPQPDHGVEDLVLRPEMVVEIAARNADRRRDVGEGGRLEAVFIEQPVGRLDDLLPGRGRCHPFLSHSLPANAKQ